MHQTRSMSATRCTTRVRFLLSAIARLTNSITERPSPRTHIPAGTDVVSSHEGEVSSFFRIDMFTTSEKDPT